MKNFFLQVKAVASGAWASTKKFISDAPFWLLGLIAVLFVGLLGLLLNRLTR